MTAKEIYDLGTSARPFQIRLSHGAEAAKEVDYQGKAIVEIYTLDRVEERRQHPDQPDEDFILLPKLPNGYDEVIYPSTYSRKDMVADGIFKRVCGPAGQNYWLEILEESSRPEA
jgi:hypothetical protein